MRQSRGTEHPQCQSSSPCSLPAVEAAARGGREACEDAHGGPGTGHSTQPGCAATCVAHGDPSTG